MKKITPLKIFQWKRKKKKHLEEFCGSEWEKHREWKPLLALSEQSTLLLNLRLLRAWSVKNGAAPELRIRNASVLPDERLKDAGVAAWRRLHVVDWQTTTFRLMAAWEPRYWLMREGPSPAPPGALGEAAAQCGSFKPGRIAVPTRCCKDGTGGSRGVGGKKKKRGLCCD